MQFFDSSSTATIDIPTVHLSSSSKLVTPGQLITSDVQFMRGHGTFQPTSSGDAAGGDIYASIAGQVEKVNKLLVVNPVNARYTPEIGDVVVGRIVECMQKKWRVDIRSRSLSSLHLASVTLPGAVQRRKLEADELQMRSFFGEGDLLVAEVQAFSGSGGGDVALHTRSLKYGKLRNGQLVTVDSQLVQRSKSHFLHFEALGIDVVLGVNGMLWICAHTAELSMEQVEQQPDLLYTNQCLSLSRQQHLAIARMSNCIQELAAASIMLNRESLTLAYQLSLQFEPRDLVLQRHIRDKWILAVKQHISIAAHQSI